MPTYAALLRGVNVGKAKRVPMAEWRTLLTDLGYTDVATLLNSGNAVFRAAKRTPTKLAADIAAAIANHFAFDVTVIVLSAATLDIIVKELPMTIDESEYSRLLVAFVQDNKRLADLSVITPLVAPPEQFVVGTHAAYVYCANGILESKGGEALLGKVGTSITTRNWATVLKLHAMAHRTAG